MKMKKRILSLTLAVVLIVAMAIPAFAANRSDSGTYEDCYYAAHTYCRPNSIQCILENSGGPGDPADYYLQAKVLYFYTRSYNGANYNFVVSTRSTYITNFYNSYDINIIASATPAFYINNDLVLEYSITAS